MPQKENKEIRKQNSKKAFRHALETFRTLQKNQRKESRLQQLEKQLRQRKRYSKTKLFRKDSYRSLIYAPCSPKLTYRLSAVLSESIIEAELVQALYDVAVRFPSLRLDIRPGFFNFYLQENRVIPQLGYDIGEVCEEFDLENNYHLFRLVYFKRRISVEFISWLCDFTLAKHFLCCLLERYFEREDCIRHRYPVSFRDKPNIHELDCPFSDVPYKKGAPIKNKRVYKLKGEREPYVTNVTSFELDYAAFGAVAKQAGGETPLLIGCLRQAIQEYAARTSKRYDRDIVIGQMQDFRMFYPTESYHNFTLLNPLRFSAQQQDAISGHTPQAIADHYMAHAKRAKYLPFLLKRRLHPAVTAYFVDAGGLDLERTEKIIRTESVAGGDSTLTVSVIRYGGNMVISIASKLTETLIEREFYKALSSYGLNMKADTNRRNSLT